MRVLGAACVLLLLVAADAAWMVNDPVPGSTGSLTPKDQTVAEVDNLMASVPELVSAKKIGAESLNLGLNNPVLSPDYQGDNFHSLLQQEKSLKGAETIPEAVKKAAAPLASSCVPGGSSMDRCSLWAKINTISALRGALAEGSRSTTMAHASPSTFIEEPIAEESQEKVSSSAILTQLASMVSNEDEVLPPSSEGESDSFPVDSPGTWIKIDQCTPFADVQRPYFQCTASSAQSTGSKRKLRRTTDVGTLQGEFFQWRPSASKGFGIFYKDLPNTCVSCVLHNDKKMTLGNPLGLDEKDLARFSVCSDKSNAELQEIAVTGKKTGKCKIQYVANTFGFAVDRQTKLAGMPVFVFPGVMGTSVRMKVKTGQHQCGAATYGVNSLINAWVPIERVNAIGTADVKCCEMTTARPLLNAAGHVQAGQFEFEPRGDGSGDPWEASISIEELIAVDDSSKWKKILASEGYYFKKLFDVYRASGLYKYVNAVPYDWRTNPADAAAHTIEYDRLLKRLAAQTKDTGLKAQFVGHSMGSIFILGFLRNIEEGVPEVVTLLKKYFAEDAKKYGDFATKEMRKQLLTDRIDHVFFVAAPLIGSSAVLGHVYQGSAMLKKQCIADMRNMAQTTSSIGALLPTARQAKEWMAAAPAEITGQGPFVKFKHTGTSQSYTAELNDLLEPLGKIFSNTADAVSLSALKGAAEEKTVKRPGETPPEVVAKGLLPSVFLYADSKNQKLSTPFAAEYEWDGSGDVEKTKDYRVTGDGTVPGVSLKYFEHWAGRAETEEYSETSQMDNGKIKYRDLAAPDWCPKEAEQCEHQGVVGNARVIQELVNRGRAAVPE